MEALEDLLEVEALARFDLLPDVGFQFQGTPVLAAVPAVGLNRAQVFDRSVSPQVESVQAHNGHLRIDLLAETDTAALVSILVGAGVQVDQVRRAKASLEEVFLTLTGDQND